MSGGLGQPKTWARQMAIANAYRDGENTVDIAVRYNISRQRVEQIARKNGLPHRHPHKRPTRKQ